MTTYYTCPWHGQVETIGGRLVCPKCEYEYTIAPNPWIAAYKRSIDSVSTFSASCLMCNAPFAADGDPLCSSCRKKVEAGKAEQPTAGSPEYLALLDTMRDLHQRKNAGYAGIGNDPWRNFRMCEQFGISAADGVITRMSDKWSRVQSLWKDKANEQVGESVEDTLMDLASYALILVCLLRETPNE